MKLELKPDITDDGANALHQIADKAGVSKDGVYSWVYKESVLELIYAKTNETFADWRFGKALKDKNTIISCVTDFECSDGRMLLVATENLSDEGTLCLFSFSKKKIVRAIEFPRKIRAVEIVVTNTKEDGVPSWVLSRHLNFFYGLAAVGTEGGYTYLVDLRLDDVMLNPTNEIQFKKLTVCSPSLVNPKAKRNEVCSSDRHMAVLIDEQCHRSGQFYHRRQDDSIDKVLDEDDVCVTCLKYLNQAGILAIGFNFGCFQLWQLYTPVLDYSTRYTPDMNAVSNFVVQEPENDPRNLVYLWVGRDNSVLGDAMNHGKLSSISLYQLCFNKKETHPGFGVFYKDLESVCGRLDHNLQVNPYLGGYNQTTWSSQLISAYTITNPVYTPPVAVNNDSFEESSHGNDLSLSVFVWRAESKQSGHNTCYWMAIFDLNRWYHAQMPHAIRCHGNVLQVCPYWAVYKLDDVVALSFPQSLLHVQVTGNNVLKFINKSPLPPEEHSFPSAMEITDVRFITPERTIQGHCYGWQGHLLQKLMKDGAMHLVQPDSFYHQCLQAQLIPQNYKENITVEHQRKSLMNLSLDYNLTVGLIHNCIQVWGDGEFVDAGCSLTYLLDWAWTTVAKIKGKLDSTCQVLYDCSGRTLDSYTECLIRHNYCSLVSLKQVFTIFLSQTNITTDRGQQELEMRQDVLRLLVEHFDLVQWCVMEGLLPEVREGNSPLPGVFAYHYGELCRATNRRRAEFKLLKGVVPNHSLLLIDALVRCADPQVSTIWQTEGEDNLYPPTSMQALVNLFLLEDVLLEVKQAILLYFLQDLAAVLGCNDNDRQNIVVSFVRSFGIMPSLVHTVHGLWCIDHRDYEEGLRQLVNPNVQHHVWSSWVDVAVVNTLLAQGQETTAARYVYSGHGIGATLDEQKLNIAVLIRNRKVSAAMDYMRQRCYHKKDPSDLMPFLLKECQQKKLIGQLLQLHLLQLEELEVEKYLREKSEPQGLEPLLLYYLTHSRFVEAFTLNEEMNKLDKLEATCPAAREKAANRNRLMDAYLRVLPDITRKVLMEKQHRAPFMASKKVEVSKPKPLSTLVYKKDTHMLSRSHLIMAVMDKVEEVMNIIDEDQDGEIVPVFDNEDKNHSMFVATPLTPRHKSFTSLAYTPEISSQTPTNQESLPFLLPTNPLSSAKRELQGRWMGEPEGQSGLSTLTKECLDLLKTPFKGPGVEVSPKPTTIAVTLKTPQSILKVRRLSKSLLKLSESGSPKTSLNTGRRPKKLGFSASDSAVTSPSSPLSETSQDITKAATPKQLRFVGLSPSPSPSPLPVSTKESLIVTNAVTSFVSDEDSQEITIPNGDDVERMSVEKDEDSEKNKNEEANEKEEVIGDADVHGDQKEEPSDVEGSCGLMVEGVKEISPSLIEGVERRQEVEKLVGGTEENEIMKSLEMTEGGHTGMESFDEGSSNRYDDEMDNLVRPNLLSPWKHNQSSEEVVTVSDEISSTLNVTHVEGVAMVPTMTSSPLDDIPMTGSDKEMESDIVSKSQVMLTTKEERSIIVESREENDTAREIQRNVLLSLVAPRQSEPKSSLPILDITEYQSLSSQTRTSQIRNLDVDVSAIAERSLRSKNESSPDKVISSSDSPPATPPLSKRARMLVRETRKSKFVLVTPRRELRSSRKTMVGDSTVEKHEVKKDASQEMDDKDKSRLMENTERKSPARSARRKAIDDNAESENEEVAQDEVVKRLRKTPERKSPARSVKKIEQVNDATSNIPNVTKMRKTPEKKPPFTGDIAVEKDVENLDTSHELDDKDKSRLQKNTERKSPSRSAKRKAADVDNDIVDDEEETQDLSMSRRRLRKTPERRSPARSVKKSEQIIDTSTDVSNVSKTRKTPERSSTRIVKKIDDTKSLSDSTTSAGKSVKGNGVGGEEEDMTTEQNVSFSTKLRTNSERKSPARYRKISNENGDLEEKKLRQEEKVEKIESKSTRSVKKTNAETEMEVEIEENARINLRQRNTPERKSPSRSVRKRNDKADLKIEHVADEGSVESGISSRLRSPSRDRRSKTPERKLLDRKSRLQEKQISENIQLGDVSQTEWHEPNEEFMATLGKEEEVAPSSLPSRRKSARLNTPERTINSSQVLEVARRSSRGRSVSISLADSELKTNARLKTPDRHVEEEDHNLRRSRRKSRTPERFRTELGDSPNTTKKSVEKMESTPPKIEMSPSRKLTGRGRKSPGRSTTKDIVEPSSQSKEFKRNLTETLKEPDDNVVKESNGANDTVWSEELPSLRLDQEEVDTNKDQDKPTIEFKDLSTSSQVTGISKSLETDPTIHPPSFVFSNPLTHTDDLDEMTNQGHEDVNKTEFVFSQPTVAEGEGVVLVDKTQTEKKRKAVTRKALIKSKRQCKTLLDSPDLLPLSPTQTKKERSRTRMSEIQKASANVVRRYSRQSGPVTRRLVPSKSTSD